MDLISLRVLYFRSLKVNSVLNLLTKYLFQYRTVTIPHVGTIQIVQHTPQLDVVDKVILPPGFSAQIKSEEKISAHQLNYLNGFLQKEDGLILEDLQQFGSQFNDKIKNEGLDWSGVGRFDKNTQVFSIPVEGLAAVTAERVMRNNPDHQVLVGDRQTSSLQLAEEKNFNPFEGKPRFSLVTIGWILLALSVVAIAILFYQGKFSVHSGGSRMKITTSQLQQGQSLNS